MPEAPLSPAWCHLPRCEQRGVPELSSQLCPHKSVSHEKGPCSLRELPWLFLGFAVSIALVCVTPVAGENENPQSSKQTLPFSTQNSPSVQEKAFATKSHSWEAFSICVIAIGFSLPFMPNPYAVIFFLIYFFNTVLPPLAPNRLLHNLFYSTLQ